MRFVIIWASLRKAAAEMQVKHLKNIRWLWHLMSQIWKHHTMLMTRQNWSLKLNKSLFGR